MEGLSKKAREAQGLSGGVVGIVFVAAAVVEEGHVHGDLPFAFGEVCSFSFFFFFSSSRFFFMPVGMWRVCILFVSRIRSFQLFYRRSLLG